ncbi:nucleotide exchange factor GrpE [Thioalkalivibrio sp.]|uniref:nucleotide exchange factor GrpE n=1 Tax=Thioalkalivibrio sp. TaxID=2093813 RepID=UPI003976DF50
MSNQRENGEHESDPTRTMPEGEPEAAASNADAEEGADVHARLAELEALAEQRREQLLRLQAELENQRRRFERELESAHKYAMERFAAELLNVCDSLEMGLDAARKTNDASSIIEGTELTLKAFHKAFEKFGIEAVEPTGERFDPERHQAMTTQESSDHPPNTVLLTLQKGYLLQGRVLRPAMVIVSRAPSDDDA